MTTESCVSSGQFCQAAVHKPLFSLAEAHALQFRAGFLAWLVANVHVWAAFEREANRVWHRGRRHYSARTLIEHLRHETALADDGADFKLNNNAAPDLARLYLLRYPERGDLFELRARPAGTECSGSPVTIEVIR